MRNKQTNFLQVVVLYTGIVYIISGLVYFISPSFFAAMIRINVNQEWMTQLGVDEFIFIFYTVSRLGAFILFTSGLAMILPLFDPLKYRGLVYYNGLIFSSVISIFLLVTGFVYKFFTIKIMGGVFAFQAVITFVVLMITRSNANRGIE